MTFWAQKHRPGWWKNAVLYQIYPKSFQDANGDGIGDLPGITARLDYLQTLGVDALWLSPIFASPQVDNGYDISDYRAVDPMFGTLDDLRALIAPRTRAASASCWTLCSTIPRTGHRWFQEAKKSKDNPCHDYYIWRDGTPDAPPNGMKATFGGPAWTWVPELGQYYFHQFAPQQPDLNWENPAVRRALYDMINFWIAEGRRGLPPRRHRPDRQGAGQRHHGQRSAADGISARAQPRDLRRQRPCDGGRSLGRRPGAGAAIQRAGRQRVQHGVPV